MPGVLCSRPEFQWGPHHEVHDSPLVIPVVQCFGYDTARWVYMTLDAIELILWSHAAYPS